MVAKNHPKHPKETATAKVNKCLKDPDLLTEEKIPCAINGLASQIDSNQDELNFKLDTIKDDLQHQITDHSINTQNSMTELLVFTKSIKDIVQIDDKKLNHMVTHEELHEELQKVDDRLDQIDEKLDKILKK